MRLTSFPLRRPPTMPVYLMNGKWWVELGPPVTIREATPTEIERHNLAWNAILRGKPEPKA